MVWHMPYTPIELGGVFVIGFVVCLVIGLVVVVSGIGRSVEVPNSGKITSYTSS